MQDTDKTIDVRFVERRVQLVQHAERAWFDLINREEQGHRGHRLLAAGEQRNGLQLFARRPRDDVDAAFQNISFIYEQQVCFAAAEDFDEHTTEILTNLVESLGKHLLRLRVVPGDDFEQLFLRLHQILVLPGEELIPLLGLLVFVDRHQVHRPHLVDALLQSDRLFCDGVPIGGDAAGGHFLRRQRFDLRRAFVGDGDGNALAANIVEVHLIFLLHSLTQVLHGQVLLRELDVQGAALVLQFHQAPAQLPQRFLACRNFSFQ